MTSSAVQHLTAGLSVYVLSVALSRLIPATEYRIIVYSVNGVSDVSGVTQSADVIVRTEPPGESLTHYYNVTNLH